MKIGIFPGSFNPVHIGHLALANYIAEYNDFDEIWFLITPKNPLKNKNYMMEPEFRLALLEKAIKDYPKFKICTIEWDMPQPTYTINTLQKLRMMYPQNKFELIIGSDNWQTIHRWKDYQMILKNFTTLVYPRMGTGKFFINHPNVSIVKGAPKLEISSSFIRKGISRGKDLRFYMPAGIYEDIVTSEYFKQMEMEPDTEDSQSSDDSEQ
ncbi:nicotinate-nucleotide adenylyltransferase [Bacteroidales bacterium OttesenSCG-928-A17]|nr:nicotinate-nucleotide adenylyltransferase [Bacteroidales bacterium OttesenSCG-928-A17]